MTFIVTRSTKFDSTRFLQQYQNETYSIYFYRAHSKLIFKNFIYLGYFVMEAARSVAYIKRSLKVYSQLRSS